MTLRYSLLLVEQNKHNELYRVLYRLIETQSHCPSFEHDVAEVRARIADSAQHIKELSE